MNKVYEVITDRIVSAVESGATLPWRKPWSPGMAPRNLLSDKPYRGINAFVLAMAPYGDPRWLTFKQAKAKGAKVRKGEHATPVVFWKVDVDKVVEDGEEKERKSFILRYYNVFNVEQVDGLVLPPIGDNAVRKCEHCGVPVGNSPVEAAEAIVDGYDGPDVVWNSHKGAFYVPVNDVVHLPPRDSFKSPEDVYDTLFHELVHSTGHENRLDRPELMESHGFGSEPYGREELVAEFGAAFLCGIAGVDRPEVADNEAAYIANWLKACKDDPSLLVTAAGRAQKAADYILGVE